MDRRGKEPGRIMIGVCSRGPVLEQVYAHVNSNSICIRDTVQMDMDDILPYPLYIHS